MASTTIKVPSELRDRLNAEARRERTTVAGVLENLLAERKRADSFRALRDAIANTDRGRLESYRSETGEWEQTDSNDSPA